VKFSRGLTWLILSAHKAGYTRTVYDHTNIVSNYRQSCQWISNGML